MKRTPWCSRSVSSACRPQNRRKPAFLTPVHSSCLSDDEGRSRSNAFLCSSHHPARYDDKPTSSSPPARGRRAEARTTPRGREATMSQALEGIRVIDFTHDQAGPSCTQMLAWLGADVIKIERPPHGDRARRLWATRDDPADSYFFLLLNSNKRSIVVDLKTAEGKDIARRLVKEADVVAENLGPGVMERLGLGYEAV